LAERVVDAFRRCLDTNERLYVLDWQHDCYSLDPYRPFTAAELEEWPIGIEPNGDYYIFLTSDFRIGTFGHPWEETLCIFGQPLLNALDQNMPTYLKQPIRVNGRLSR